LPHEGLCANSLRYSLIRPPTRKWSERQVFALLVLLAVVGLAYAPAPGADFVWDDRAVVEHQLPELRGWRDAFQPPAGITRWSYEYYRPLVVLSYLADARLFGLGVAGGPQVMNVLAHGAATILVYLLLVVLLVGQPGQRSGALLGAALFAVHPIHTESVSWMAGRSDVLATLLLLAAALAALRARQRLRAVAGTLVATLLLAALLAKEVAVVGAALLPALVLLAPEHDGATARWRARWTDGAVALAAAALAIGIWLWLRQRGASPSALAVVAKDRPPGHATLGAAAFYLVKLVWPWPQAALLAPERAPSLPGAAAIVLVAGGAGLAALRAWWRSGGQRGALALLAAAWLVITLSVPVWLAANNVTNTPFAERHLYLPSVALSILLAAGWCALREGLASRSAVWRGGAAVLAVLGVLALAGACIQRGLVWRDNLQLWTDATRLPDAPGLAWLNLGLNRLDRGDDPGALTALDTALRRPDLDTRWRARAENGIGTAKARQGAPDAAAFYRAAAATDPAYYEPHAGLARLAAAEAGSAELRSDRTARDAAAERAIAGYVAGLSRNATWHPVRLEFAQFLARYGGWLRASGEPERARRRLRAALEQLDELDRRVAPRHREFVRGRIAAEVGVTPDELRRQIDQALQDLR
jgi:tetratricopeptide (TPR) repeat protein